MGRREVEVDREVPVELTLLLRLMGVEIVEDHVDLARGESPPQAPARRTATGHKTKHAANRLILTGLAGPLFPYTPEALRLFQC